MDHARTLRDRIEHDEILPALGGFDAMSARLIEHVGGEVVYMSGSATSSATHGRPDVGLTTMTEMVDTARRMAAAVDVPVLCDADTGYGNALNVRRTVREYERAGVAGVHLEDQTFPKRCGHFEGKSLIPTDEMVAKVRAATDAREDDAFVVVARTDARAVEGFDAAVDRARAYVDAGADVLFFEAPRTEDELQRVGETFPDVPLLANMAEGGQTPLYSASELEAFGFDLVIYPTTAFKAAAKTMREVYEEILSTGTQAGVMDRVMTWEERDAVTGHDEIRDLERRYETADDAADEATQTADDDGD